MIPNLYHLVHHHNCDESCYQCDLYYVDRIGIKHTHEVSLVRELYDSNQFLVTGSVFDGATEH